MVQQTKDAYFTAFTYHNLDVQLQNKGNNINNKKRSKTDPNLKYWLCSRFLKLSFLFITLFQFSMVLKKSRYFF